MELTKIFAIQKGMGLTANKSLPRSITGGQLFDCKRKLYLSRKSSFSSYSKDEWKSIDLLKTEVMIII